MTFMILFFIILFYYRRVITFFIILKSKEKKIYTQNGQKQEIEFNKKIKKTSGKNL